MKDSNQDLLSNLYIASPCNISWSSMQGDDRQRLCGGCSRNVYNISDMTRDEAEEFLRCNGTSECMTFFRRQDGTIMTDDCPVGLRKIRDRCKRVMKLVAGLIAVSLSMFSGRLHAQNSSENWHPNGSAPSSPLPGHPYKRSTVGGGLIPVRYRTDAQNPQTRTSRQPARHFSPGVALPPKVPKVLIWTRPQTQAPTKKNPLLHTEANEFFQRGEVAAANNQTTLAELYYEKALDFYDAQPQGDANFRRLLEARLNAVRAQRR